MRPFNLVNIDSDKLVQRPKKGKDGQPVPGQFYYNQVAWMETFDKDGNANRYPERIEFYAPKDEQGHQKAYPVGDYYISPTSVRTKFGRPELGFLELKPVAEIYDWFKKTLSGKAAA